MQQQSVSKTRVPSMIADTESLVVLGREGGGVFNAAEPFPHLHIPTLIKPVCRLALCEAFFDYQESGPDNSCQTFTQLQLPCAVRQLLWELCSSTLIRQFCGIAGAPPLLPDPFMAFGGVVNWVGLEEEVSADCHARHPGTDLANRLRLELFLRRPGSDTEGEVILVGQGKQVSIPAEPGSALLVDSNNFELQYHSQTPADLISFVAYFYENDRAREPSEKEQNTGGY
jgi:hypothetical protein